MENLLKNTTVLITGGTGSFGFCFVSYILQKTSVAKVIIYSRDEYKQFIMKERLSEFSSRIRFFIGDIRDIDRLKLAFKGVDYVVHAAAMKHVSLCEYNPFEAVKTNIMGTQNIASTAIECGVKKIISLSTDKAVNPINLYGATKLAADKIIVASNSYVGKNNTALSVVRFGNFAGSRGSVIPFFQKLLSKKQFDLPLTHESMSRFWISLEDACKMTIHAILYSQGGETFIPKLPSFFVSDLITALDKKASFHISGLREGERLSETLIGIHDIPNTFEFKDHFIIYPNSNSKKCSEENETLPPKGKPLEQKEEYSSSNNSQWLSVEDIQHRLQVDLRFGENSID